jgi:hypothetical protein
MGLGGGSMIDGYVFDLSNGCTMISMGPLAPDVDILNSTGRDVLVDRVTRIKSMPVVIGRFADEQYDVRRGWSVVAGSIEGEGSPLERTDWP